MESLTQSSITSLRNLPPKQALILLLAERRKRELRRKANQQVIDAEPASTTEVGPPPFANVPSLVLDKSHVISDLYYKKARNKVYWGGRGAIKTWGAAEALIRLTSALPLRVLCCREFMNSIKDSSHKILSDTIERLGMSSWFTVTANTITSRVGAEFLFKGLHGNDAGIRSTEGIDICLVEEAQSVGETSWQALEPTIRAMDSEMWVLFNMSEENDATYQRFVVNALPTDIVHYVTYLDNPFFDKSPLKQIMERDKKRDYHLYEHIWLGKARRRNNAIILNGKYRAEAIDPQLWRQAERVMLGLDFGFANDPTALVRQFIVGRKLYIEYEAGGYHVDTSDIPKLIMDKVPGTKEWPIKADGARPETISALRRHGYNVTAAEKWTGSVEDGITHLRDYEEIIVDPRCEEWLKEAYLYRYKVDKKAVDADGQPLVLPVIVDANNHYMDATRYALDGYIQRGGELGVWAKLGGPLVNNH